MGSGYQSTGNMKNQKQAQLEKWILDYMVANQRRYVSYRYWDVPSLSRQNTVNLLHACQGLLDYLGLTTADFNKALSTMKRAGILKLKFERVELTPAAISL
jgi:hypothetical protein